MNALSAFKGQDCFEVCNWLLPVVGQLPSLSLSDAKQLLGFAEAIDHSYRHVPIEQLSPHISARPELGRELGAYLRNIDSPGEASVIVWAGSFAGGAPKVAAAYLAELLTGGGTDTRLAVILTTCLPNRDQEVKKIVASHDPSLVNAIAGSTEALGAAAWNALCFMANQSGKAAGVLRDALLAGARDATIAIANSLRQVKDPAANGVTGTPLAELVDYLLFIGFHDADLRHDIDAAVSVLFLRPLLRPVVTDCVKKLGAAGQDVVVLYPRVFGTLASKRDEFATVMTDWLTSPDTCFSSLASLLSMCANGRAPVVLDDAVFAAQTTERRLKAARRMLAFTHNGPILCEFCALIAEMKVLGTERFNLAGQMLDKAFLEFPAATEAFLESKTIALVNDPDAHIYRDIYANALQWRGVLEKLPHRKEILPTDLEMQALRNMSRRFHREVMRLASERSFFSKFCSNTYVAQGKKFAIHTANGVPQISHMAEMTHSVELPSSELADPMRGLIERENFIRGAR